jgi:hypothetical protein
VGNTEIKLNILFSLLYGGFRCRAQTMSQFAHMVFQIEPHNADTSLDKW